MDARELFDNLLARDVAKLDISPRQIERLKESGFKRVRDIIDADMNDLTAIPYVGEVRARGIQAAAYEFMSGCAFDAKSSP